MANLRMGYIGKSFTTGVLGIVGTLVACGGGGVTSTVAQSVARSPYLVFASEFVMKSPGANDTWAKSQEGGDVTSFAGNGLAWRWDLGRSDVGGNPDWLKQQQAYGVLFGKGAGVDASSGYAGLSIKAPENGSVNVTESGTMVIQTGNGTPAGADAAAFMGYTIELAAGTQGGASEGYAWPKKCTYQLALTPGSRPNGPTDAGAIPKTNPYGLQTYRIALNTTNFTCTGGTLADVKSDLRNISVLVAAANNSGAVGTSGDKEVFMKIGQISFSK